MLRFAANLSLMFTEVPFLARFERAARAGFRAVEFQFPYEHALADLVACQRDTGLECVLFNAPPGDPAYSERGIAALPGREREFDHGITRALEYATALNCPRLHVMAGLTSQGASHAVYVQNLRRAAARAATSGVTLLVEPINQSDIPGYLINRTADALAVIEEAAASNVRLQFDLYHRQRVEGDLAHAIQRYVPLAGHLQIAQAPDRGEPDVGEINYRYLFDCIEAAGYDGWIGCEYKPRGDTEEGLRWRARLGVGISA